MAGLNVQYLRTAALAKPPSDMAKKFSWRDRLRQDRLPMERRLQKQRWSAQAPSRFPFRVKGRLSRDSITGTLLHRMQTQLQSLATITSCPSSSSCSLIQIE